MWFVILIFIGFNHVVSSYDYTYPDPYITCNDTWSYPREFQFGAGTSAYQIEGGWNEDGRTRSLWDWLTNTFPAAFKNNTGNVACDSYHRYEEDIAAMKEMGLDFYRFSLSWSRILPNGIRNKVNQAGVDYYNNLLDKLDAAGIEPVVTIFHWDTPLALEYLGGDWTNPMMADYFADYADLVFSLFGDRVKLWSTINEPRSFCQALPNRLSISPYFKELPLGTLEYLCGHHVLLAHAKAYRLYERKYKPTQKGRVSITLNLNFNIPLTNSSADVEAADRANIFDYGWLAHPLVYGDYPPLMKKVIAENSARQNYPSSRLPNFTVKDKLLLKGAYDLMMINTYTASLATSAALDSTPSFANDRQVTDKDPPSTIDTGSSPMAAYPESIRMTLNYIQDNYKNPEIMVTENGFFDGTGDINDASRIEFIRQTLHQMRLAMCVDKIKITSYTYWSLLDNFEWNSGYTVKFGLIQVDFNNPNRTRKLKDSAYYYRNLLDSGNLNDTTIKR